MFSIVFDFHYCYENANLKTNGVYLSGRWKAMISFDYAQGCFFAKSLEATAVREWINSQSVIEDIN